jgi:DnaK suppressor protein
MTHAMTQPLLAQRLREREAELVALLHHASRAASAAQDPSHEVQDFKDLAGQEAAAAVDDVALWHAAQELAQVAAALRRVANGCYGDCRECGAAIAESRLQAMPAAAFCTNCQGKAERAGQAQH